MRAVFSAWLAAGMVAVLALLALKALAPHVGSDDPIDEYAQVLRVHLPWLSFSILMAFIADFYVRGRRPWKVRVVAAVPVPVSASLCAALVDIPWSDTPAAVILHLIEALLGAVLGSSLANAFTKRGERGVGAPPDGAWGRESGR